MNCKMRRETLSVEVVIHYREVGFIRGAICDITAQGMCIDMRPVVLPEDRLVELVLFVPGAGEERLFRLQALVAHAADGTMGLLFHRPDEFDAKALLQAIATRRPPMKAPIRRRPELERRRHGERVSASSPGL
jgi:hypothetical protein